MTPQHPLSSARAARSTLVTYLAQHHNGTSPPKACALYIVVTIRYLYALEIRQRDYLDLAKDALAKAAQAFKANLLEVPEALVLAREALNRVNDELRECEKLLTSDEAEADEGSCVQIQIDEKSPNNFYTNLSGNIAEGGVFVVEQKPIPIGTAVKLMISLEGRLKLQTPGRVAWVRQDQDSKHHGVGIRFEDLGSHEQNTILRFLSKREPLLQV